MRHRVTRAAATVCVLALVTPAGPAAGQSSRPIAFVGVNVVPMDTERVLERQMVVVRGGRIISMEPSNPNAVPPGALTIAGNGRYLVPGLADMHVHVPFNEDLTLWLANGVTLVRNLHATGAQLAMREEVAAGRLFGPTMLTSGPLVDGPDAVTFGAAIVSTPEEAVRVVEEQAELGYDFIKVYSGLSAQAYLAVVRAARAHGLPVVGHVPRSIGVTGALLAGQRSIEHLSGYAYEALADHLEMEHGTASTTTEEWFARPVTLANLDPGAELPEEMIDHGRLDDLANATRVADTWNVPTLVLHRGMYRNAMERTELLADPRNQYVNPLYLGVWAQMGNTLDAQGADENERFAFWRRHHTIIARRLHEAGAKLLLGTDAPNPYVIPGFSVHDELRALTEAGLTRYQALAAATRNAAEFLGTPREFGVVAPGARADLILVDGNPLDDLSHLMNPAGVMARGVWYPAEDLARRLADIAKAHRAARQ